MLMNKSLYDIIEEKSKNFNILGIAGSLQDNSSSTKILKIILEKARKNGNYTNIIDLKETRLPLFNPNKPRENTDEIEMVTKEVINADAFILATPDYHGSMSGTLKNFLDYFWKEFSGKTFGYIISSHEKGLTVLDQMRTVVRQCYGWSVPYGVSINSSQDFDIDGKISNNKLEKRIESLARDIFTYGILIRSQFLDDINNKEENTYASQY